MRSVLKTILVCVSILAWAGVLSAQTTTTTTTTTAVPTTPDTPPPPAPFPNAFNAPPCDFSNTFYEENGILAHVPGDSLNQKKAGRFGLFRLTGPPASSSNGGTTNPDCGAEVARSITLAGQLHGPVPGSSSRGTEWNDLRTAPGGASQTGARFKAHRCDGSVQNLSENAAPGIVGALVSRAGGELLTE